jgi:hypothetical protein
MAGAAASVRFELTAQGAPDKFSQAQVLAPGLVGPKLLALSRDAERQGDAATRQLRSGPVVICIIASYTVSTLNLLARLFQLGHGRDRARQRIHSDHDHSSCCSGPGAPGFGRSKTLREQVGRHPGGPLQRGGHEDEASPERKDGRCVDRQGRASLRQIRVSQTQGREIRLLQRKPVSGTRETDILTFRSKTRTAPPFRAKLPVTGAFRKAARRWLSGWFGRAD